MHELQNTGIHYTLPNTVTYNASIGAYTRVTKKVNKDAHIKVKKVLGDMINLRNNGNPLIAPKHRSYNELVIAWLMTKQPKSSDI